MTSVRSKGQVTAAVVHGVSSKASLPFLLSKTQRYIIDGHVIQSHTVTTDVGSTQEKDSGGPKASPSETCYDEVLQHTPCKDDGTLQGTTLTSFQAKVTLSQENN